MNDDILSIIYEYYHNLCVHEINKKIKDLDILLIKPRYYINHLYYQRDQRNILPNHPNDILLAYRKRKYWSFNDQPVPLFIYCSCFISGIYDKNFENNWYCVLCSSKGSLIGV